MNKTMVTLLSAALTFSILAPIKEGWRGVYGDSFPMSWYPMFSKPRRPLERITYMVGVYPDEKRTVIPSTYFVRGPMNQARRHVAKYGRNSTKSMELCERAAKRIAKAETGRQSKIVQVRLVRGSFSREDYFGRRKKLPVVDYVKAACDVPGRDPIDKPNRGTALKYKKGKRVME
ncbi:MAG: hypothetical protein CL930_06705 [Deltaproteobacteria bacterium]|nr:hypothetical protein [Deltaproteobacteria bacterium]